tara:strand:+ start:2493 stop:3074 length:582 start_codon:yes stop_codon:yes gene_type:complete
MNSFTLEFGSAKYLEVIIENSKKALGFFFLYSSFFLLVALPESSFCSDFELESLEKWSEIEKNGNEKWSNITANLALVFLIIGIVYPLTKFLMRSTASSQRDLRDKLSGLLSVHIIALSICLVFTLVHWYYAEATSAILILATLSMIGLHIVGSMMRYMPNVSLDQRENLSQVKRFMFWIFLFTVLLGHVLID